MSDDMPTIEQHRGVPIHDFQPRDYIDGTVKPAIDYVYLLTDPETLYSYACDHFNPVEARLFAGAKYRAHNELRTASHGQRLGRLELLDAHLAGADSLSWADPARIGCLLDVRAPGDPQRRPRSEADRQRLEAAKKAARR